MSCPSRCAPGEAAGSVGGREGSGRAGAAAAVEEAKAVTELEMELGLGRGPFPVLRPDGRDGVAAGQGRRELEAAANAKRADPQGS